MKIIVDIPGGFGNQLFGYAFGYALSREVDEECELCIHTPFQDSGITWELQIDKLKIEYDKRITYHWGRRIVDRAFLNRIKKKINTGFRTKVVREDKSYEMCDYLKLLSEKKNVIFYGNWENEKFFKKYRKDLIEMLNNKNERNDSVMKIINDAMERPDSVGMHVRMGDKAEMGISLSETHYNGCIDEICKHIKEPYIYVISDDVEWCREKLKSQKATLVYPEYYSDNRVLDDWLILKSCNNHIVANSTFSWWAAWLSQNDNQIVICPQRMKYKLENWIPYSI